MKKSKRKLTAGESSVLALLLLCLVLAAAITGIRITSRSKEDAPEQFVELEGSIDDTLYKEEEPKQKTANTQVAKQEKQEMDLISKEDQVEVVLYPEDGSQTETARAADEDTTEEEPVQEVAAAVSVQEKSVEKLDFSAEKGLFWPVNGNVILDYSMDSSIYFPTLKQYKYNPAIVISAEEGTKVLAGTAGKVVSVGIDTETGTTVTLELGNGYTATYGQLKEVPVTEGDMVSAQDVIGYVSEPSKYYSVEGSNLYFELQKDANPVDPLDYLK